MIHPVAWVIWAGAILVTLSTTRNPFYLGLILLWIALVTIAVRPTAQETAPIPISPLRFGLFVTAFSAGFNALTVHFGDTPLLELPQIVPLLGGPITLEALTFGALNGLVLTAFFAAFSVINRALPIRAVVRLIPQGFYPVAVVTSIAVTFVPATLRHFQQIRQAQAVRGHRVRGLKDWLPLMMPLLVGGLERALQLAEAMTARGFAATQTPAHNSQTRLVTLAGLVLLVSGWLLRLVWGQAAPGLALLLVGVGLIAGVLWVVGQRVPKTVYRPDVWTPTDWLVAACAVAPAVLFFFPWPGLERASIYYYPYPALTLPVLHPGIGLATAGLLAPALVVIRSRVGVNPVKSAQPEMGE